MSTATYETLSASDHSAQLRKAVVASTIGTTIEWYDFFIYGTAAGLIFGKLYFPNEDPLTATLAAFGTYFIGFVGRPIGAAIFGHYGDRIGRKATLIATLLCMGIATFLIAFVPTYQSIGIWGAVILTFLRMVQGIRQGTSNPAMSLPADVRNYPDAVAQALNQLRLVGVDGPYSVLLSADAYTALAEARDYGDPVLEHVRRLVSGEIIWAPAISGAFVLTTRGGDFDLCVGQDFSIGYANHTDTAVRLYLQETFTFLLLTTEAAVALAPAP